jgi:hypothetical protein
MLIIFEKSFGKFKSQKSFSKFLKFSLENFFFATKLIAKEKKFPTEKKIKVLLTCENVKKMQMKKEIQFIFDKNDRRQSMLMMREEVFFG